MIEVYAFQANAKEIRVNHYFSPVPPIRVDKNQFRIIVQNLLHNAIKFTPKSGEINISYEQDERAVQIHLRDSGDGMDEQAILSFTGKRGIRMHSQVGTADEKGAGLGLLLVKQFVAQNGGSIRVKNIIPSGTAFSLTFNLAGKIPSPPKQLVLVQGYALHKWSFGERQFDHDKFGDVFKVDHAEK